MESIKGYVIGYDDGDSHIMIAAETIEELEAFLTKIFPRDQLEDERDLWAKCITTCNVQFPDPDHKNYKAFVKKLNKEKNERIQRTTNLHDEGKLEIQKRNETSRDPSPIMPEYEGRDSKNATR